MAKKESSVGFKKILAFLLIFSPLIVAFAIPLVSTLLDHLLEEKVIIAVLPLTLYLPLSPFFIFMGVRMLKWKDPQLEDWDKNSGHGEASVIPEKIKGWNWAAASLPVMWGGYHGLGVTLLNRVPYVGNIIFFFIFGFKGNEWAWRRNKWKSPEEFLKSQRKWKGWGVAVFALKMIPLILILFALPIGAYHAISKKIELQNRIVQEYQDKLQEWNLEEPIFKKVDVPDQEGWHLYASEQLELIARIPNAPEHIWGGDSKNIFSSYDSNFSIFFSVEKTNYPKRRISENLAFEASLGKGEILLQREFLFGNYLATEAELLVHNGNHSKVFTFYVEKESGTKVYHFFFEQNNGQPIDEEKYNRFVDSIKIIP